MNKKSIRNLRMLLIAFLLFLIDFSVSAQCFSPHRTYQAGEQARYHAVYHWGFIWLHAGDVVFTTRDTIFQGKDSYYFESVGESLHNYDWLYKVRDRFQSIATKKDMNSLWYNRNTSEGGYKVQNDYRWNYSDSTVISDTWNSKKGAKKDTLNFPDCSSDLLSAIYICRNIDFNKYTPEDTIPVNVIIDNQFHNLYIRYLGKEILKTRDKKRYRTIKFSVMLVGGTIFKGGEDLNVWVSDDKARVPILVEADILIGSVKAALVETKGLKYPMSSLIEP